MCYTNFDLFMCYLTGAVIGGIIVYQVLKFHIRKTLTITETITPKEDISPVNRQFHKGVHGKNILIYLEQHTNGWCAYEIGTDQFLGKAETPEDLTNFLKEEYPNTVFSFVKKA